MVYLLSMRKHYTLLAILLCSVTILTGQIQQHIIKGSDSNVIYQSFYSGDGGELESIKISTDQTGFVTIRLFEDEMQKTSENPIWEMESVAKTQSGELLIDFNEGHGLSKTLEADKKYCFSIVGGGNIHHSFLDDVYDGGNYRFEDGIERKGDLFFELSLSPIQEQNIASEITPKSINSSREIIVFPNPTFSNIQVNGIDKNTEAAIFDNEGKLILKKIIQPSEKLKLSHLTDGAYFLRIRSGEEVYTKKIIKTDR